MDRVGFAVAEFCGAQIRTRWMRCTAGETVRRQIPGTRRSVLW